MFQVIQLLDPATQTLRPLVDPQGKLGNFAWSPDGARLAYVAAKERKDHDASQLFVVDIAGGALRNLTPPDFRGHVRWAGWRDAATVAYLSAEGAWNTLAVDGPQGGQRRILLAGRDLGWCSTPFRRARTGTGGRCSGRLPPAAGRLRVGWRHRPAPPDRT
jgi:dipeptidyl aminopeptidase/acylaminoacyl peptidase